jgi:glycosyltransferase involved in cell wall biosynthesis
MQHHWAIGWTALAWILAIAWGRQAILVLAGMPRLVDLTESDCPALGEVQDTDEYHLTVIVPACNEEARLGATLQSLASSTGIRLQIVVIDDRSTDRTGEIADQFAEEYRSRGGAHCIEVVHNRTLPRGWLGKTHAMQSASERARAPWILFTDADTVFAPDALQRALSYAAAVKADHFVLMPTVVCTTVLENAMVAVMHSLGQWVNRYWKVGEKDAKDFLGVGGFNLVRTKVFQSVGGFTPLRLEVVEDMSFGWMVKRAGYRSCVVAGPGLVKIRWIEGAFGIVRNIEKNGFSIFRYRAWLCLLACLALLIDIFVPLGAIAMGGWATAAGLAMYFALGIIFQANRKVHPIPPVAAVLFAPCTAILCFGFVRSMMLTLHNKGVSWRGTRYTLAELRENAVPWNAVHWK